MIRLGKNKPTPK